MANLLAIVRIGTLVFLTLICMMVFVQDTPQIVNLIIKSAVLVCVFIDAIISYIYPNLQLKTTPNATLTTLMNMSIFSTPNTKKSYIAFVAVLCVLLFLFTFSKLLRLL